MNAPNKARFAFALAIAAVSAGSIRCAVAADAERPPAPVADGAMKAASAFGTPAESAHFNDPIYSLQALPGDRLPPY